MKMDYYVGLKVKLACRWIWTSAIEGFYRQYFLKVASAEWNVFRFNFVLLHPFEHSKLRGPVIAGARFLGFHVYRCLDVSF